MTVQNTFLIVLALCYAAFASASTATYFALKKDVKMNKALEIMRKASLAQMILGWIFFAFTAFVAFTASKTSVLHSKDIMASGMAFAFYAMLTTASVYLGAYGSLGDTSFSSKKVLEDAEGKENEKASKTIRATMIVNLLFIFVFLFIISQRSSVHRYTELMNRRPTKGYMNL